MIKNKKAVWFPVLLVVMTLTTLSYAAWVLNEKAKPFTDAIGERQFNIIKTYDEAEKHLLFVDQAGKFSSSQSIYEQALKGGYYTPPNCSKYRGFTLWSNGSEHCYPNQFLIKNNLKSFMNNILNSHFDSYSLLTLPQNNYDFLIINEEDKTKISGYASKNILLAISAKDEEQPPGFYSIKPSFKTETAFNLTIYDELTEKAKQLANECKVQSNIKSCVEGHIITYNSLSNYNYEWGPNSNLDCEHKAEEAFYELVDKFEECQKQENSFCYCSDYPIDRFNSKLLKDYSLKLTQNDENTLIELYHKKRFTGLNKTIKNRFNFFHDTNHNVAEYIDKTFNIPKDVYNFYYSSFVYNDAIYLARNNENNIGIISFPPDPDLKTPNCFAEKYIVIDSNNYAYQESLDLFHLIKEKEGNAINLIDVITADDNLLYLYTDGTEEGKAKARLNAINKLGRELGGIDLYIYLDANEENNKKLLLNYYPYSDSEELANNLKTNLLTSLNLDTGSVTLPPELKYDFLIHKSNLLSSAISLNYSFTRRDIPLLMDNTLKSIKDYLPQDPEQSNFKLCVNTKSQLLTYNKITDQTENKDIIIKFGLKIE